MLFINLINSGPMSGERAAHYLLLIIFATGMINFCNKFSVNIFTLDDGFLDDGNPCSRGTADLNWAGVHNSSSAPRDSRAAAEAGRI